MKWAARGACLAVSLSWLAACAPAEAPPPIPAAVPKLAQPAALAVELVAGDTAIPAFGNATGYLANLLSERDNSGDRVHLLGGRKPAEPATLATVVRQIGALQPPPGGGCVVFLTSHGAHGRGFYLAGSPPLMPAALDQALSAGCGAAPTVVIVSACFSGQFAMAPMPRANRIILTAARADRASFGCASDSTFTFFDECLLGALPGAPDWQTVFERARGCVHIREQQVGAVPSEPQASFGAAVSGLPAPWATPRGDAPDRIVFVAGPGHYAPSLVPWGKRLRQRQRASLAGYAEAAPPKAMALLPDGLAVWTSRDRDGDRNADAMARLALERCEFVSGGACSLFARDDRVTALLPSGMTPLHPPVLVRNGPLSPDAVPFIRDDQRAVVAQYLTQPFPKALAVSPGQGALAIAGGRTIEAARQAALDRCQGDRRGAAGDCVIYAENDRIVLNWGE